MYNELAYLIKGEKLKRSDFFFRVKVFACTEKGCTESAYSEPISTGRLLSSYILSFYKLAKLDR